MLVHQVDVARSLMHKHCHEKAHQQLQQQIKFLEENDLSTEHLHHEIPEVSHRFCFVVHHQDIFDISKLLL
jgi:hypothetical protein